MKTIRQLASFLLQSKDKISWRLTVKQVFDIDLRCVYMFFLIKNMTKITRRGNIEDNFYLKTKSWTCWILEKQKSRWQNAQDLISRWQNMSHRKIWQAAQYKISNVFRTNNLVFFLKETSNFVFKIWFSSLKDCSERSYTLEIH